LIHLLIEWGLAVKDYISINNNDDWNCLLSFLPEDWEQMAADCGALLRLRGFDDAGNLLRTLLIHLLEGSSLRQTAVQAKQLDIANVSDVALLKRLNKSGEWFRKMAHSMIISLVQKESWGIIPEGYEVQLVDATCISKPGNTGTDWRVHYGIDLPTLQCKTLLVTDASIGETLKNFEVKPQRLFIADRGYSKRPGIAYVVSKGGDVLVRMNTGNLPLKTASGKNFDLLKRLRRLRAQDIGEWAVSFVHENTVVRGRVCAIKKSRVAAKAAQEKIIQVAIRKQQTTKPETLEYAKYVCIFTTLTSDKVSATNALEMYRGRWQVELAFKRLKSLLELGALPKKDPPGAKSWIHGKLFAALLIEALIENSERFSPWGYIIRET
jgi:hypothetical protein